jgi:hypothetical protein
VELAEAVRRLPKLEAAEREGSLTTAGAVDLARLRALDAAPQPSRGRGGLGGDSWEAGWPAGKHRGQPLDQTASDHS